MLSLHRNIKGYHFLIIAVITEIIRKENLSCTKLRRKANVCFYQIRRRREAKVIVLKKLVIQI
jgi:hypothetical protein